MEFLLGLWHTFLGTTVNRAHDEEEEEEEDDDDEEEEEEL